MPTLPLKLHLRCDTQRDQSDAGSVGIFSWRGGPIICGKSRDTIQSVQCVFRNASLSAAKRAPRRVNLGQLGLDTDTVELTIKTLLSHLRTRKFNAPINSSRMA
eukprot:1175917-Prorocentrum_minimum.AAC.1